jgi:hypothetical protein
MMAERPGYTAEEMRQRLGVASVRTVYRRAARGEIAAIRLGRRTYYRDTPVTTPVADSPVAMTGGDAALSLVRAVIAQETRELTERVTRLEAEIAALRASGEALHASTDGDSHDSAVTGGDTPRPRWWRQWSWRRP